jgi:hypothetical protein
MACWKSTQHGVVDPLGKSLEGHTDELAPILFSSLGEVPEHKRLKPFIDDPGLDELL